jgi:tRNA (guanine-N(7)-)-methyltransferase subunit TRM82
MACRYVSQLLIPSWSPNTLISGGGDDFLAHWDWTTGELLEKVDIHSILYPKSHKNGSDEQFEEVAVSGIWQVPELQLVLAYDET